MPHEVSIATSDPPIEEIVHDNTNTAAITTFPVPTITRVTAASGINTKWENTRNKPVGTLWFLGTGSDGNTVNYRVYLWYRVHTTAGDGYIPKFIGGGVYTLSTYVATVAQVGTPTDRFADTITDTSGLNKLLIHSPADNTPGHVEFDTQGASYIEVKTDLATGTTKATVLCQLGDHSAFFSLRRLVGDINDATTDSLHGKIGTDTEMRPASLYDMLTTLTTNLALVSGYTLYDGWRVVSKTITANPGTAPGTVLFTLSASQALKVVELQIFAVVGEAITDTAAETLTIKTEDGTTLIAATTATALVAGELWHDASPDASVELSSVAPTYLFACPFTNNTILLEQSGATAWGAGSLTIYCRWRPIHAAGTLTAS
jgi:hypothetical protein